MAELDALRDVLAELPPPDERVTTGEPLVRQVGENEYEMVGMRYLPVIDRLWKAFRAAGFPESGQYQYFTWLKEWVREHPPADPNCDVPNAGQVAIMSREDCFNLLRYIERQERFGEGMWSAAHHAGWFHAIARRLIELGDG